MGIGEGGRRRGGGYGYREKGMEGGGVGVRGWDGLVVLFGFAPSHSCANYRR